MQLQIPAPRSRTVRTAGALLAMVVAAALLRKALFQVAVLSAGGALLAFLVMPLAAWYERRMSRSMAALAALVTVVLSLALALALLLPGLIREMLDLSQALPQSIGRLSGWVNRLSGWMEARLPGLHLPDAPLAGLSGILADAASRVLTLASGVADAAGRLSMMAMLAYFFLCDRDALLLRLELLLPRRWRRTAVRMGKAVGRELRLYLRGQALVALAVTLLATAGLMLIRVRSALVLGPVIGLLNMIPYFGPFIGGVPAVLIALGDSWQKALLALGVLALVQQLDGSVVSPRIMGNVTGLSPALVLLGIFGGARLAGIPGMLLALPALMAVRTLFRVFVQKCENI